MIDDIIPFFRSIFTIISIYFKEENYFLPRASNKYRVKKSENILLDFVLILNKNDRQIYTVSENNILMRAFYIDYSGICFSR